MIPGRQASAGPECLLLDLPVVMVVGGFLVVQKGRQAAYAPWTLRRGPAFADGVGRRGCPDSHARAVCDCARAHLRQYSAALAGRNRPCMDVTVVVGGGEPASYRLWWLNVLFGICHGTLLCFLDATAGISVSPWGSMTLWEPCAARAMEGGKEFSVCLRQGFISLRMRPPPLALAGPLQRAFLFRVPPRLVMMLSCRTGGGWNGGRFVCICMCMTVGAGRRGLRQVLCRAAGRIQLETLACSTLLGWPRDVLVIALSSYLAGWRLELGAAPPDCHGRLV